MLKKVLRTACLAVVFILATLSSFAQKIEYKEYSYTEFFQMIEAEESDAFSLRNAFIIPDIHTDKSYFTEAYDNWSFDKTQDIPLKDTLVIDKSIELDNVQFIPFLWDSELDGIAYLSFLHFKKDVQLTNVMSIRFGSCTFDQKLIMNFDTKAQGIYEQLQNDYFYADQFHITHSSLKRGIYQASLLGTDKKAPFFFLLGASQITLTVEGGYHELVSYTHSNYTVEDNEFTGKGLLRLFVDATEYFQLKNNHFEGPSPLITIGATPNISVEISENTFDHFVGLSINSLPYNANLNWYQFANKSLSLEAVHDGVESLLLADSASLVDRRLSKMFTLEVMRRYVDQLITEDEIYYKKEQLLKGFLVKFYKSQNDLQFANAVYIESKDLETKRLAHLYKADRTFESFFSWKINQFLKIFSAYGTKPAKAVVFSTYVILAFALVYLFFPNHWDSHGKNRIMDRYRFFLKYVNRDSGMHEVYLDEKQPDLLASEDFRTYLQEQGKTAPKFFMATALPLYKWSVAGTKTASWFLSKVDVLQGKWSDTDDSKKGGKSFLLITAFLIALTYDIFIKMLNALMLSINTFTTLGFGEIPIKGLPRYLAIVQGFIGWFMLTIFSVSLISQLLN